MSWTRRVLILAITVMLAACGAVDGAETPLHVSSLTSNQTTPAPETPLTPVPTASTTSSASTTTGTNTSTDRTTMIIVVACAVAAFAIVVIIVIIRSRHSHKDELDHEATTPNETAFSQFNTETTTVNNQRPPDAVPVALKSYPVHRPSQAYTERSTVESLVRESAFAVEIPSQSAFDIEPHRDSTYDFEAPRRSAYVMGDSRDLDSEDGDVAMLESYAEPRTYNDGSFLSVVDFGDSSRSLTMGDSSQSLRRDDSSRSLDVDSYRRNHTVDPNDTLLSNDSIMSYWHHDDEESLRGTTTFTDAKEPPTEKYL